MKFPVTIKHRRAEVTIYAKKPSYPFYRIAWRANGKRLLQSFGVYSEAKAAAEKKARELAQGNQTAALTAKDAADLLAIREAIEFYRRDTGNTVSPVHAVTQYLEAAKRLGDRSLSDAVEGYLSNVAVVVPKLLSETVEKFIAGRASKAFGKDGQRSALNPKYVVNTAAWLKEFDATFPASLIGDLTKQHLALWIGQYSGLSVKSRNDRRNTVRMFLKWAVRNDYLPPNNRLLEADALAKETLNDAPIEFYRAAEFRALLEAASEAMKPIIALQGLAGLRMDEALRLDWTDVFGIEGCIEVSSSKSKTRQRRLVEICPALSAWLAPYRQMEGKVAAQWETASGYVQAFLALRKQAGVPARRNGLRRGFVTHHFALHSNEGLTAAQAGHSPTLLHQHYRGLSTKSEASKWFAVRPAEKTNVIAFEKEGVL